MGKWRHEENTIDRSRGYLQASDSKKTRKEVSSTYNITRINIRNVNQYIISRKLKDRQYNGQTKTDKK